MSPEQIFALLVAVPVETKVTFVTERGDTLRGECRERPSQTDPTRDRRWTVDGWEWFFDFGTIERVGIVAVTDITIPNIEVFQ